MNDASHSPSGSPVQHPSSLGTTPLSAAEARVLGCLLEKESLTPDNYPLSLNSLRLACNQTTSREPVVDYDEATVKDALHRLERRGLARFASGAGSRAAKYRHLLAQRLPLEDHERALITVLLLRGPQTPGALKQRADRMRPFGDLEEVQVALEVLADRGLAVSLGRRPGQKEERWRELLSVAEDEAPEWASDCEEPAAPAVNAPTEAELAADRAPAPNGADGPGHLPAAEGDRAVADLARRVAELETDLAELRRELRAALDAGT